jgi:hypothetical protein
LLKVLRRTERKEIIAKGGLLVAENAIHDLFESQNTGKLLVEGKPYEGKSGCCDASLCLKDGSCLQ